MVSPQNLPHYSYKTRWLASILLFLLLACYTSPLYAASEFSADNVTVDANGKDATEARTKALAGGEIDAFKQFATKRNPAKASEIIAKTSPTQINAIVRGFEVIEEKMTANHYHAVLRYNFDPKQVKAMFGEQITESKVQPPKPTPAAAPAPATPPPTTAAAPAPAPNEKIRKAVLVLPVYKEGEALKLWQDDNKWRTIWYDAALEAGGGLVIAPLGDLDDRVDVDDTNVDNATRASLYRMLGRYGVGEIYVVTAFYNQKADPKPTLEVTLKRLGRDKTDISHMNYTIHSTETLDKLYVRASNDIAHALYKQQTIDPNKIEFDRLKEINARVNTSDMAEWVALRKRLLTHGNIVSIKLTSISFYETSMVITYKGTSDMLGKTLVASGLRVMEDGDSLVLALK
jgi:hypothetical protein